MTQQALNCTKYQTTKRILPFMKIHKPYHTGSKSKGYPNIQFLTAYVTVYCKIIQFLSYTITKFAFVIALAILVN